MWACLKFPGRGGKTYKKTIADFSWLQSSPFFSWCCAALLSSTRNSTQNPIPFVCTILFRSQKTHFSTLRFYWAFIPSCPTSFFLCCSFHFHSLFSSSRSLLILSLTRSSSSCTQNTLKKEGYNQKQEQEAEENQTQTDFHRKSLLTRNM